MEFIHGNLVYCKFLAIQINKSPSLVETSEAFKTKIEFKTLPENKHRRYFVFKEKLFSRVEIMGLVVNTKKKDDRIYFTLDDFTDILQCFVWLSNKNLNIQQLDEIVEN